MYYAISVSVPSLHRECTNNTLISLKYVMVDYRVVLVSVECRVQLELPEIKYVIQSPFVQLATHIPSHCRVQLGQ